MDRLAAIRHEVIAAVNRAMKSRYFAIGITIAVAVIIVDQLSKYWILHIFDLPAKGSAPVLPFFKLSMVWNQGVSFGLFSGLDARVILAAFSLGVSVALAFWLTRIERVMLTLGVGAVIGGAVGNLIDRIRFGAVVDFLDFSALYFPWVFNVADSAISIGAGLILIDAFWGGEKSAD